MIKIENLSFSYGKKPIFENFNLEVKDNETLLITGINGVGKSTLLRLMAGVLLPDKGSILIDSKPVSESKKRIGFISDKMSLYNDMTVDSLIKFHKNIYGLESFYGSLIKHTKIKYDQKVGKLSVGQRAILHLSLILSQSPDILLIDEVLPNIDAYLRELFLNELLKVISEKEITLVLVNLNFYDIENLVDRVVLLKDGKIMVDEPIEYLKDRVKKIVCEKIPGKLPVIYRQRVGNLDEIFVYPFDDNKEEGDFEVIDLDLTEIIKAFIGGEYVN